MLFSEYVFKTHFLGITLIALIFLSVITIKKDLFFIFFLCLFFFLLGFFRCSACMVPAEDDISKFISAEKQHVFVSGIVSDQPEPGGEGRKEHITFKLALTGLLNAGRERAVSGTARVRLYKPRARLAPGDELVLEGKISAPEGKKNPAGFDHKRYLACSGTRGIFVAGNTDGLVNSGAPRNCFLSLRRLLARARDRADSVFRDGLSGLTREIARSVVLGIRTGLTPEVNDIFMKTGTMHILAVSGLHVGIVAFIFLGAFYILRLPRKLRYVFTIICICLFAVLTGCKPSCARAALMSTFIMSGMIVGQKTDIVNSLALSALVAVFFQPFELFNPGFILSYGAVLSIIYIFPIIKGAFSQGRPSSAPVNTGVFSRVKKYLKENIYVSMAVFAGMAPLTAYYFHAVTPLVIFVNLLAVPALFLIVTGGMFFLITGMFPFLSLISTRAGALLTFASEGLYKILSLAAELPFSCLRVPSPGIKTLFLFYMVMILSIFFLRKRGKKTVLAV
ncbi:MAG: ComEC/Rec2 family competence protein, partial [Candidatus Omnitrophota bacterium]